VAKKNLVKFVSTGGTGYFLVKKRSPKNTKKLSLKKYDPVIRKHVSFKEEKIR
jgi:large subunit ribosomal protein L33